MSIQAPYRFVPLSNLVVLPEWAEQVSHDKPFKDGICGEFGLNIKSLSELCVGGEQTPSSEQSAGIVNFFKTPDGQPAIPASSLKGMLRNVLEIATFSRFKQVEDQKLGVRDISQSQNFYTKAITKESPKAGWLTFKNSEWVITPCKYVRVHQQEIINNFNINYDDWKKLKTIRQRYSTLTICPNVKFEDKFESKNGKSLAKLNNSGSIKGQLVVTGQPGPAFKDNKSAKKYEFIFFSENQDSLTISAKVMSGFKQIHADTDEWKFWQKNISQLKYGIPVFYHTNTDGSVRSLGLALMYKLAYDNSIHDAIGHTSSKHIKFSNADFSDLLFGFIEDDSALRGRVNIGLGFLNQNEFHLTKTMPTVLSSPKATYYPLYIRQTSNKDFNQLMQNNAELSGWKRYPVKPVDILPPPDKSTPKVQVRFETLPENTQFSSKIRFHNLRPVELGALIWVLDFGGRTELRHQIGIGKPYGLGQVSLAMDNGAIKLRRNDHQNIDDVELFLMACRQEFIDYMENIFKSINQSWEKSGEIKALLGYAKYDNQSQNLEYLSTPKAYADLRKKEYLDEFMEEFHQYKPTNIESSTIDFSYHNKLDAQMMTVKEIIAIKQAEEKRKEQKKTATEEERTLLELEDFIAQAEIEVTKTIKGNASKKFKQAFENNWSYFDDEQKIRFKEHAKRVMDLTEDKALGKLINKINNAD